ncbi:MAG: hypothetical protein D6812_13135 [Deltaproteobacteria bacterium]|nr:MAG: hypothetical protein D6812_13135 [Deltaproteobacteria bacterium]
MGSRRRRSTRRSPISSSGTDLNGRGRGFRVTALLLAALAIGGLILLPHLATRTAIGRRWLDRLERTLAGKIPGLRFELARISLFPPGVVLEDVSFGGPGEPLLQAPRLALSLDWRRLPRLSLSVVEVSQPQVSLTLSEGRITGIPAFGPAADATPIENFSAIEISLLRIEGGILRVTDLASGLVGVLPIDLYGTLSLGQWQRGYLHLRTRRAQVAFSDRRISGISLDGTADFSNESLRISLDLGVGGNHLRLSARRLPGETLRGSGEGEVDLASIVQMFDLPLQATGRLSGSCTTRSPNGSAPLGLDCKLSSRSVKLAGITENRLELSGIELGLRYRDGSLDFDPLRFHAFGGEIVGKGRWPRRGEASFSLALTGLQLAALSEIHPFSGQFSIAGELSGEIEGGGDFSASPPRHLSAKAFLEIPTLEISRPQGIFAVDDLVVAANVSKGQGGWRIVKGTLDGRGISATCRGEAADRLRFSGQFDLSRLSPLLPIPLRGFVGVSEGIFNLRAGGGVLPLWGRDLAIAGTRIGKVRGRIAIERKSEGGVRLRLDPLHLLHGAGDLRLRGEIWPALVLSAVLPPTPISEFSDLLPFGIPWQGVVSIPVLAFNVPQRRGEGRLDFQWTGERGPGPEALSLTLTLSPIRGRSPGGPVQLDYALSASRGKEHLEVAGDLRWPDRALRLSIRSSPLSLAAILPEWGGNLRLSGDFEGVWPRLTGSGRLMLYGATLEGRPLGDAGLSCDLTGGEASISGDLFGLAIDGRLSVPPAPFSVVRLQLAGRDLDLSPWGVPLRASADLRVTGNPDRGRLAVEHLAMTFREISVETAEGVLVTWNAGRVQIPPLDLVGKGITWRLEGAIDRKPGRRETNLDLSGSGHFDLSLLSPYLSVFPFIGGDLSARISLFGPPSAPKVRGSLHLTEGTLEIVHLPESFERITATASLTNAGLRVEGLQAHIGGGRVEGGGMLHFAAPQGEGGQRLSFDMGATVRDAATTLLPWLPTVVREGNVTLTGSPGDLHLTADAEIARALYTEEIDLDRLIEMFKKRKRKIEPIQLQEGKPPFTMQIHLFIPDTLHVENNLLQAQLAGDLTIVGTNRRIGMIGNLETSRGKIFLQNLYTILSGNIEFIDPNGFVPFIDVNVETEIQDHTISLNINGLPNRLVVEPYASHPPLSRDEVIALLSFGSTDLAQLGDTERGLALAYTAAGKLLGGRLKREIDRVLPIDTLEITPVPTLPDATGSTLGPTVSPRITIGKRLSRNVEVHFSQALLGSDVTSARIELTLSEVISLLGGWDSQRASSQDALGTFSTGIEFRYRFR